MKLLINDKEIAYFLASLLDHRSILKQINQDEKHTAEALDWALVKKGDQQFIPQKFSAKAVEKITCGVKKDLQIFYKKIKYLLRNKKKQDFVLIFKNIDFFIEKLGENRILDLYKKSTSQNFVKSLGLKIDKKATLVRRKNYLEFSEDCLFRNMDGNENLILQKINNHWPFWFIDTGYTNFLSGKGKKWHRLVKNNLHHSVLFDAPVDRLEIFESFPKKWRTSGEKILLIEPGNFCAKTFGINIEQWKTETINELKKYTNKQIVVREKLSKKLRKDLYNELCNEDYYCVININSNAATESIWAGVPVITLDRHITNSVSKSKIFDINDLYRGPLANWLAFLSYNQFTYDEIVNGAAIEIVKKYHV
jgi:hypothetical protein